jgi:hypothetical protein
MKSKLGVTLSALIFGFLIMSATPARADFLGLAPGDYIVTLQGSSTLCGGSDCVGTIHIGTPGSTGFDWLFENVGGAANDFDFSPHTHIGSNGSFECAVEGLTGLAYTNCLGSIDNPTILLFFNTITQQRDWGFSTGLTIGGLWAPVALAVPEPMTSTLLVFGLGVLGLCRRLREK